MTTLSSLKNITRPKKQSKRVGRGIGSGVGKTCGRGEKGAKARAGYKSRPTYEGGQFRMFMHMPERGFSNARFRRPYDCINLKQINHMFEDGDIVDLHSLCDRGYLSGKSFGLKILGEGELTKKVTIYAHAFSDSAREKLAAAKISFSSYDSVEMPLDE